MRLLAISEHYFPRVGGTVNYLHETLSALARQGLQVELWVPGPMPADWLPAGLEPPPYDVRWIDVNYPPSGEPARAQRYEFCRAVNEEVLTRARSADTPDVIHVVFGLFVMETLDTQVLRCLGVSSMATVHNVPPQECRLVGPDGDFFERVKEEARLRVVGWKNRRRLGAHRYDAVVVPSESVRDLLAPVLKGQSIDVISHGPTEGLIARMHPPANRRPAPRTPVRLLTVGGYAPHKGQHLIPTVAALLRDRAIEFEWDVVGPPGRVVGYFDSVVEATAKMGLARNVRVRAAAPLSDLAALYDAAHLYVQPSLEEGFCITALDAAAAGLPVIASPAGALVKIAGESGGAVAPHDPRELARTIIDFVEADRWGDAQAHAKKVRAEFAWDEAARALHARYVSMAERARD